MLSVTATRRLVRSRAGRSRGDCRIGRVWPDEAKGGELIAVPLNDDALAVLRACQGQHPTHVFTHAKVGKGGRVLWRRPIGKRSNNTAFRKARDRAGLPGLRWHDLRHTWATWHAQAGTPELVLQRLGGWADLRMVSTYAHLVGQGLHAHAGSIRLPPVPIDAPRGDSFDDSDAGEERLTAEELPEFIGVDDGIRTRNNRNHNPGLYR
jgi:integrase